MKICSVVRDLEIVRGDIEDYRWLSGFHYRDSRPGPYVAVFSMRATRGLRRHLGGSAAAVIVYTMPTPGLELRNVALSDCFGGLDKGTRMSLINRNIRCIGRVIVEPRFRGLGLAVRLVRETMPLIGIPIIEAMAVMGRVNPFFEKAGMTAYRGGTPRRCVQMIEAFSAVGIEKDELIDSEKVQRKLERLGQEKARFIEAQMRLFLQGYGRRRDMAAGVMRTKFVLGKLTERPVYYIWFNKELNLGG